MALAQKPNMLNVPNNHFRKNEFEAVIDRFGYDVLISKAVRCSCQTKDNSPLSDCQNCQSTGWIWINPLQTKALMHSINYETKLKSWSWENVGTVSISVRSDVERLSYMDKITVINNAVIDNRSTLSEVLTVRTNDSDENFVFCSYEPQKIFAIYVFNGSTNKLQLLDPETDYSISEDNPYVVDFTFDFSTVTGFNGSVSILYAHLVSFCVIDIPHNIRNSTKIDASGSELHLNLPINAIGRVCHNIPTLQNKNGLGLLDNTIENDPGIWRG